MTVQPPFDLSTPAAAPLSAGRQPWARALPIGLALVLAAWTAPALAQVRISQVYGGGGNSGAPLNADFVELRNAGGAPVSLAGWSLQYASATGTAWGGAQLTPLVGSIPAGGFYLVKLATGANAAAAALPAADATGSTAMSATAGKLALVNTANALSGSCPLGTAGVVDFVGFGATANCFEGSAPAPAPSNTTALLRAGDGCTDGNNNSGDFSAGAPAPRNSAVAAAACGGGGGGAEPMAAAIYTIQGRGASSPLVGARVLTQGVVTRINNNGFFMQDLTGDGDPVTSDGIFVFTGSTAHAAVVVGNLVSVTATVAEFNTGAAVNAETAARTVTQLSGATAVTLVGSGYSIAPTPYSLPETVDGDLERVEGMLVTLTGGPLTVAQNFFQGRYGQLTLAAGGRPETPTNRHRPGAQAQALADENARRRIILDDGSTLQNPNPTPYLGADALPRAGDRIVGAITGVIDYGLATNSNTGPGDYRIHPTVMPVFAIANPRSATLPAVGGNVKLASFNVLNYFTAFTDGRSVDGSAGCSLGGSVSAANCRGAGNLAEFERQRAKIVAALAAIDADAVGLMEIQNNGNVAVNNLVAALNARVGAGSFASVALPPQGSGSDAIRVAMIYKPARLAPLGMPVSDPDPVNNRPTLAQAFVLPNGERFSLLVNHLKSKSGCPVPGDAGYAGNFDSGDGQGCWNALRVQQAQRLRSFAAQVQAAAGSPDVVLIGDFNAYAREDPVHELVSNGFADQLERFAPGSYSYVFDGAAGRLDHVISSASLSDRVSLAAHWHINADETALADYNLEFKAPLPCGALPCPADPYGPTPWRSSDHDPVLLGLNLYKSITATGAVVTGTAGDDIIVSGAGRRTLTGGGGNDIFRFAAGFAGGATVTDFDAGDRIALREVMRALGITSADPIGQQYLLCRAAGADAQILVDPDAGGPAAPRAMILLKNRDCGVLAASNFIF